MFHPKSFEGYEEQEGGMWLNLAPLKPNYIKNLNWEHMDFVKYESNNDFYELSLIIADSSNPISTWEMTKEYYEDWTKKEYSTTMEFLPIDYISPQDSDSSSNYLLDNIFGIRLAINQNDSLGVIKYLSIVGFETISEQNGLTRVSNNDQFIELQISSANNFPTIKRLYMHLNANVEKRIERIGNSRIECDGKSAIWYFEMK